MPRHYTGTLRNIDGIWWGELSNSEIGGEPINFMITAPRNLDGTFSLDGYQMLDNEEVMDQG